MSMYIFAYGANSSTPVTCHSNLAPMAMRRKSVFMTDILAACVPYTYNNARADARRAEKRPCHEGRCNGKRAFNDGDSLDAFAL